MSRDWQPGDVAMVTQKGGTFERRSIYFNDRWHADIGAINAPHAGAARPLVVIDPASDADVNRLCKVLVERMHHAGDKASAANGVHPATMRMALKLFANPKPDEPTGLGAVVEDSAGFSWARCDDIGLPWYGSGRGWAAWPDVDAVKVLSEGVPS